MTLWLQQLELLHYKNYPELKCLLDQKVNLITGLNGSGKTNLVDAIYFLSFCKSSVNSVDKNNVQHGQNAMRIYGRFEINGDRQDVQCKVQAGRKKVFSLNENPYKRLSEHIGLIPLVIICPDDIQLVKGHSDERRKLLDSHLAQFDREYLTRLMEYNRVLKQRNAMLKSWAKGGVMDGTLLRSYDQQLHENGQVIFEKRKAFVEELQVSFQANYLRIADKEEAVEMTYNSALHVSPLIDLLEQKRDADRVLQRTTEGVHRDDLSFTISGHALKRTASQGQQKTFMVALKLAMYHFLKEKKKLSPILLLDDIFDKLDGRRMEHLLEIVSSGDYGQVFITDTHPNRLSDLLEKMDGTFKHIEVSQGKLLSLSEKGSLVWVEMRRA